MLTFIILELAIVLKNYTKQNINCNILNIGPKIHCNILNIGPKIYMLVGIGSTIASLS
jgi:hypothetical protein